MTTLVIEFSMQLPGGERRRLAWRVALAEIVCGDRADSVGGAVLLRPAVPAR